jgi:deoxyribodipyrimidine photo-lyase
MRIIIYWSRRDLRISDNPALWNAVTECLKDKPNNLFLPVYILEDYMLSSNPQYQFGYPSKYFLSHAIPAFAENFQEFLLLHGKSTRELIKLVEVLKKNYKEYEIEIFVNDDVYPDFYKQIEKLRKAKVKIKVFEDAISINKNIKSGSDNYYSIFTPFKKAVWNEFMEAQVLSKPKLTDIQYLDIDTFDAKNRIKEINQSHLWSLFDTRRFIQIHDSVTNELHVIDLASLGLPTPDYSTWYTSESDALKRLTVFVNDLIQEYDSNRDSLEKVLNGGKTSRLSLALAWGLISAREIKEEIQSKFENDFMNLNWNEVKNKNELSGAISFLSELIWREFYKYIFLHNQSLMNQEFQERFRFKIKWQGGENAIEFFTKWMQGETGYKIVDAAMMQLAKTGWMHNRSRMIVSSILTKNLGIDWRWGQEFFRAMLIDLDEASNNGGWQWGSSVGADPKPIRIFNPHLQAENYDTSSAYQKYWLGMKNDPDRYYLNCKEIIEHKVARQLALERYGLNTSAPARDY